MKWDPAGRAAGENQSMSNFGRRLKKLEARLTDHTGLVPNSPRWLAYWTDWMEQFIRDENPPGRIPIEAYRAVMKANDWRKLDRFVDAFPIGTASGTR